MEKRKPDFMKFRNQRKAKVDSYLDTIANDGNKAPGRKSKT
jgi:hypothetical protein